MLNSPRDGGRVTSSECGPNRRDLDALKGGAAVMTQTGNRVAAVALLWSAVAIDPRDLAAHRRLAAALANGGDIDGAAEEYARYIECMLPLGEVGRATMELGYGASVLGGHAALHAAAQKIVTAFHAIVPETATPIAAPAVASATPIASASPVAVGQPRVRIPMAETGRALAVDNDAPGMAWVVDASGKVVAAIDVGKLSRNGLRAKVIDVEQLH